MIYNAETDRALLTIDELIQNFWETTAVHLGTLGVAYHRPFLAVYYASLYSGLKGALSQMTKFSPNFSIITDPPISALPPPLPPL